MSTEKTAKAFAAAFGVSTVVEFTDPESAGKITMIITGDCFDMLTVIDDLIEGLAQDIKQRAEKLGYL